MRIHARVLAIVALSTSPAPSIAQNFYEGKTISIVVGLAPGGGYDVYARFLSRHLGKHIPGNPRIIVENKPGAATATATTYVYHSAPKDGTVMGMSLDILPFYQTVFPERVKFDMSKVQWIGNMATLNGVIAISSGQKSPNNSSSTHSTKCWDSTPRPSAGRPSTSLPRFRAPRCRRLEEDCYRLHARRVRTPA